LHGTPIKKGGKKKKKGKNRKRKREEGGKPSALKNALGFPTEEKWGKKGGMGQRETQTTHLRY